METHIDLPFSTAECCVGPTIHFAPGECRLKYDAEDESGGVVWTEIEFAGALAIVYTPDALVTAEMVEAYSKVSVRMDSPWIGSYRGQGRHPLPQGLKHFVVYFDHSGCVEILAQSARLAESGSIPTGT